MLSWGRIWRKLAKSIGSTAKTAVKTFAKGELCFVAGTQILTENGHIPIEDIKVGDYVYAENPETGEKRLKRVEQTFINEINELIYVTVNGEAILTTPGHPFYVVSKGWIGADTLEIGDQLVVYGGEQAVVEKVKLELLNEPITVYNFEVEDFHTYYVGENSILVHNKGCGLNKLADSYIKKTLKLDTHAIKREYLGNKAKISLYDLAVDKKTELYTS
ncbi:MAG: polymorphic toxin-type HINT domain-containing protein [Clostridiales bacterium]|nr:polymorphic toxin-type HINT domain-containing protein [Clostridiales bacterium]